MKPSGSGLFVWFENLLFLIELFILVLFALNQSPFLGWNEEVHFLRNTLLLSCLLIATNDPINLLRAVVLAAAWTGRRHLRLFVPFSLLSPSCMTQLFSTCLSNFCRQYLLLFPNTIRHTLSPSLFSHPLSLSPWGCLTLFLTGNLKSFCYSRSHSYPSPGECLSRGLHTKQPHHGLQSCGSLCADPWQNVGRWLLTGLQLGGDDRAASMSGSQKHDTLVPQAGTCKDSWTQPDQSVTESLNPRMVWVGRHL